MIVPAVDLTSTWIPLGILGVLVLYMVHLFLQERRVSKELLAAEATAPAAETPAPAEVTPAPVTQVEAAPAEATSVEPVAAPVIEVAKEGSRKTRSLVWRTAWLWLPFIMGVGGQAYLDLKQVIDPLIQKVVS